MIRARFMTTSSDYRPVVWPIRHPYWCTGYCDGMSVIVAYADAKQGAAEHSFARFGDGPVPKGEAHIIVIVLTVAHLDHQPENCDLANLRAYCQRHHLAHDHTHHLANAAATRRSGKAIGDLFTT